MSGRLFIIATPIGNLGDISERQKVCLSTCDLILAEDTRVTIKLLNHLGIKKQMVSCHDYNESQRLTLLTELSLKDASVALVSDAGTPLVSDPGHSIVQRAIELEMQIIPVPGPNAALAALCGSGLPCNRFSFEGFLPDKATERAKRLQRIKDDDRTLIFYVASSNALLILEDLERHLGDRPAALARELTKVHEEFLRDSLSGLARCLTSKKLRGEIVLVVGGSLNERNQRASQQEVKERLQELLLQGGRLKEISVLLALESGWSASQIYKLGLILKDGE